MRIGLLADTHVPYRAAAIPKQVLTALRGVDLILHAGDVDEPWALAPLQQLAPVHAVRGNYHILDGSSGGAELPPSVEITAAGFRIAMTHGHQLGWLTPFWRIYVTWRNMGGQWRTPAYDAALVRALLRRFPQADIIVFGHTHRFYQEWRGDTLLINPGAALATAYFDPPFRPSVACLTLSSGVRPVVERLEVSDRVVGALSREVDE
ncbi:MAG TPA: metallophosphoesterase family protein [Anaerolineae bacterium]|nr:metallophosphoesterase family protein [Anaerolineae bacterium]